MKFAGRMFLIGCFGVVVWFLLSLKAQACMDAAGRISPAGNVGKSVSTNAGAGDGLSNIPRVHESLVGQYFCCPGPGSSAHSHTKSSAKCCINPLPIKADGKATKLGSAKQVGFESAIGPSHPIKGGRGSNGEFIFWDIGFDSTDSPPKPKEGPPWWILYPCSLSAEHIEEVGFFRPTLDEKNERKRNIGCLEARKAIEKLEDDMRVQGGVEADYVENVSHHHGPASDTETTALELGRIFFAKKANAIQYAWACTATASDSCPA